MKIKVRPEDFIVEEMACVPTRKKGPFGLYRLTKRGWNTADLLLRLSRDLRIPLQDFAYGGKKDRHAFTTQHVTIKGKGELAVAHDDYSFVFLGYTDRPMGPDLIAGNRFRITIRDIKREEDLSQALDAIGDVQKTGYPNYFDDQRFGSFDPKQGFIGEKILKGHYNGALKIYITRIRPEDGRRDKERKRYFFEHWGDWKACYNRAETEAEKEAFAGLVDDPKGFLPLLQKIPREEMSLFFSAYQSFLWNEVLRRITRILSRDSLRTYPGDAGEYFFYEDLRSGDFDYLRKLSIPTPASNVKMPDEITDRVYSEVLKDRDVRPSQFNTRKVRQAFFKATMRKAIVMPEEVSCDVSDDEIYRNRKKLVLAFFLPRGSYATMFVKRLFSGKTE